MAGPRKEYTSMVVRCSGCREPHATSIMTRKDGGYVCDKCVNTSTIWSRKL